LGLVERGWVLYEREGGRVGHWRREKGGISDGRGMPKAKGKVNFQGESAKSIASTLKIWRKRLRPCRGKDWGGIERGSL